MDETEKVYEVQSKKLDRLQFTLNNETLSICQNILQHPHLHGQHVIMMAKETIDQLTNTKFQN